MSVARRLVDNTPTAFASFFCCHENTNVEVPDGEEWTARSDHLPLYVDEQFTQ